jgi:hypothetical protein
LGERGTGMKVRRRQSRGYNRTRAAEKRWRRSALGQLCVGKVGRRTREELLRNGFTYCVIRSANILDTGSRGCVR